MGKDAHAMDSKVHTAQPTTVSHLRNISLLAVSLILAYLLHKQYFDGRHYVVCSKAGIYTSAPEPDHVVKAECMLVEDDKIKAIGTHDHVQSQAHWWSPTKHTPDDAIVLPGLTDSHAHILEYGFKMQLVLDGAGSIQDVIQRIEDYIKARPELLNDNNAWIQGMGWDQTRWEGQQFPTAEDLVTPLLKNRPILLVRVDGHANWVSPRVLQIMQEKTSIPDIEGGIVMRDPHGEATGIFIDHAMSLIPRPPRTSAQRFEYFKLTMDHALSAGLTSIHDAGVELDDIKFFKEQSDAGNVPIRLYLMGRLPSADTDLTEIPIPRLKNYGKHGRLNVRSIKLFMDGALGSWGAALLKPYTDNPTERGLIMYTREKIQATVTALWKAGWQVNTHCIGDRANNLILDVYESILKSEDASADEMEKWRPRIEHAQIMTLDDLKRTGELGVIPSVQPTHATSDMWYAEQRLGAERIHGAYAYKTLLDGSPRAILPLGSDFPIEGINPLLGFYAAVSRLSTDGTFPNGTSGWYRSEALTRNEALRGMTYAASYASFSEATTGTLERGKKADFVVLDNNIMDDLRPFVDILKTKVLATVVDGRVIYGGL